MPRPFSDPRGCRCSSSQPRQRRMTIRQRTCSCARLRGSTCSSWTAGRRACCAAPMPSGGCRWAHLHGGIHGRRRSDSFSSCTQILFACTVVVTMILVIDLLMMPDPKKRCISGQCAASIRAPIPSFGQVLQARGSGASETDHLSVHVLKQSLTLCFVSNSQISVTTNLLYVILLVLQLVPYTVIVIGILFGDMKSKQFPGG